ncbi:malto-oligosyltrehalose trehalohydrolase [Ilyomonas limi]|uniref:Malto-oligosyltrehalose trehalohydrolase n=1 Tax=Ilyomonas limi TaxID=2575867 RepID=A0A4U3L8V3_9BACT|nr:malto-oligosyltrehalose trehalohydrolase [Ilyomonas limi]TKK71510.1 malto-oligosyltrehalose trehalohydrolase [Ilyomonas limi]
MNELYRPVGAFYKEDTCHFVVWAPKKESVELVVTHPYQKIYPLQKDDAGYWQATVENVTPGLRYLYRIDGEMQRPDPASLSQPEGVHKASEVIDHNFSWTDDSWKGIPLEDLIIYELHTGTFTQNHNFEGIINKMDYLVELGINAIEIMPIAQFPGSRNWGYDGVYPYAVQNSYGGVNGLKRLVNAAHTKGIAIILDVVYNHLGPEGGYQSDYAPYYTQRHKTPWGNALNFDDAYSDGVRNYFLQNALMWLDKFHIDALRMDAVHAIVDYGAKHFVQLLKEEVAKLEKKTGRKKFLIAELDLNNPRYINPQSKSGYGLDSQWIDEFHHAIHAVLTGETDGYYEDFGSLQQVEKAFTDTYVYDGIYSPHRKKIFGAPVGNNDYGKFVVFSQNHDHIGNRALGDRLTQTLSFEALKLAAALVIFSPYIPLLFMGEEYGEKNPFFYFTSHSDPDLVNAVTEGRKKEFSYFSFKYDFPGPQEEDTYRQSVLSWNINGNEHAAMFRFYKAIIQLRKTLIALQNKERDSMKVYPVNDNKVLTIERKNGEESAFIIFNFNEEKKDYTLPAETSCNKIFDSSAAQWNGPGEVTPLTINVTKSFSLNPYSTIILQPLKQA